MRPHASTRSQPQLVHSSAGGGHMCRASSGRRRGFRRVPGGFRREPQAFRSERTRQQRGDHALRRTSAPSCSSSSLTCPPLSGCEEGRAILTASQRSTVCPTLRRATAEHRSLHHWRVHVVDSTRGLDLLGTNPENNILWDAHCPRAQVVGHRCTSVRCRDALLVDVARVVVNEQS